MASGKSVLGADGIRTTRTGGMRREAAGVAVLVVGLLAGRAVLRSGEPSAPEAPPAHAPAAGQQGLPPPLAIGSGAAAPRGGDALAAASQDEVARDSGGGDVSAAPKLPQSRRGQLRALKALGIKPTRGRDGKPQIDAAPVIEALNAAGIHEGIAAFPPPGTDPPKPGIIVPDDFELPEGYVRHYQVTDDGEDLPPILMFHPDYQFVGEDGQAIALPADRVVPPDLAPPGMPIELLQIPPRSRAR